MQAFLDLVQSNAARMRELARRRSWLERFPAVVTAIDRGYDPPRYSWTEQEYDADANRVTATDARTGTATSSPAYAYGDGTHLATADLPMPVTLTRRLDVSGLGVVYEFPVYCGCLSGPAPGSGSGGDPGGHVLVPCCPNPIPRRLFLSITSDPGFLPCMDVTGVPLFFNPSFAFPLAGEWYTTTNFPNDPGYSTVSCPGCLYDFRFAASVCSGVLLVICGNVIYQMQVATDSTCPSYVVPQCDPFLRVYNRLTCLGNWGSCGGPYACDDIVATLTE